MIVFTPYHSYDSINFMGGQTIRYELIKRDTKKDKIYWSEACNDFYKMMKEFSGVDVICIMCNDISFPDDFLEQGSKVKQGEILIPSNQGVLVYWRDKKFLMPTPFPNCFNGRCFFMTYKDFVESGGFSKWLPHYLSDYDFALRQVKRGLKIKLMDAEIIHKSHQKETKVFSILCPYNPIFWTIFLLRHFNRYTPINILKAWFVIFTHT